MVLNILLDKNYPNFKEHGLPLCATTDPEIFFPERGAQGQSIYIISAARKICGACPYKKPCLAWAVENNEMGIWGGTTQKDRRVHRKKLKSNK